jgi:Uma2 family endonuclease
MSITLARREQTVLVPKARRGPHTVTDLFELTLDDDRRYEVLGGWLIVCPSADFQHQHASFRITVLLEEALPAKAMAVQAMTIGLPDGDGPMPDVAVVGDEAWDLPREVPSKLVYTVMEIVSPSNASNDRSLKREMYAAAGIPCYWRLERRRWRGYKGVLPVLVVGMLLDGEWDESLYPAGTLADVPLAFGRGPDDVMVLKLDPASLLRRWR